MCVCIHIYNVTRSLYQLGGSLSHFMTTRLRRLFVNGSLLICAFLKQSLLRSLFFTNFSSSSDLLVVCLYGLTETHFFSHFLSPYFRMSHGTSDSFRVGPEPLKRSISTGSLFKVQKVLTCMDHRNGVNS